MISSLFQGLVNNFDAYKATNVDLDSTSSMNVFNVSIARNIDIKGDVDEMLGSRWNKISVDGSVDDLRITGGKHAYIINSVFRDNIDQASNDIDHRKSISVEGTGNGGTTTPVVVTNLNPDYNPVKVRNTSGITITGAEGINR